MDPTSKETRFAFFLFFDEALKDKYTTDCGFF